MILFFDTETIGLPKDYKAPAAMVDNWPRVIQVGWAVYSDAGDLREAHEHIVKPVKFTIPKEASDVHGITTKRAREEGEDLKKVLTGFAWRVFFADRIVGHNIDFDIKVLGAECIRKSVTVHLTNRPSTCTMLSSVNHCKLPGKFEGQYKWPKLTELYLTLFNQELAQSHTALDDIKATAQCYFELKRLGVIKGDR